MNSSNRLVRLAVLQALACASVLSSPSHVQAQTAPSTTPKTSADDSALQEVIVVGVKQAIATSQNIKMEAPTFVDSITATDIGAFPDKSASDALQRITGITVNRLQSNDDSTHP